MLRKAYGPTKKPAPPRKEVKSKADAITKKYKGKVGFNAYKSSTVIDVVPTGSIELDIATGVGGYPRGRVTELSGEESSGKSTLTMLGIANAQKMGYTCALIDAEFSFDPDWARTLGVDPDSLMVFTPSTFEDASNLTIDLIKDEVAQFIVFDSVAALDIEAASEGVVGDSQMGKKPQYISQWMRLLTPHLYAKGAWVIIINQLRMKMNASKYEDPFITTGGKGIPFAASVRIRLRASQEREGSGDAQEVVGARVRGRVFKNKVSPPHKKFEYLIKFDGSGIDTFEEVATILVNNAEDFGIARAGAWYTIPGEILGQEEPVKVNGKAGLMAQFEDAIVFNNMIDIIRKKYIKHKDSGSRNHTGEMGEMYDPEVADEEEEPFED